MLRRSDIAAFLSSRFDLIRTISWEWMQVQGDDYVLCRGRLLHWRRQRRR
jgi:hypothetical protein